MKISKKL